MGTIIRKRQPISHVRLLQLLAYDPETGLFTWLVNRGRNAKIGSIAGHVRKDDGYCVVVVDGEHYLAHRLAWFYVRGVWPVAQLDHERGQRSDNRVAKLREASNADNCQNRALRADNKSGYPGVSWHQKTQKWQALIGHEGLRRHIGLFETAEDGYAAYRQRKAVLHTFQPEVRA